MFFICSFVICIAARTNDRMAFKGAFCDSMDSYNINNTHYTVCCTRKAVGLCTHFYNQAYMYTQAYVHISIIRPMYTFLYLVCQIDTHARILKSKIILQ